MSTTVNKEDVCYVALETKSSTIDGLGATKGDTWRRQRQVTTRMFTHIQLKQMLSSVCASAHNLTQLVTQAAEAGELIPLRPLLTRLSTEVIARVAFGIQTHALSKQETEFAYHCQNYYDRRSKPLQKFLSKACDIIQPLGPVLEFFCLKMDHINRSSDDYFVKVMNTMIEEREKERNNDRKGLSQARDLLDILLEAVVDSDDVRLKEATSKKLSLQEVIGNANSLVLSSVETFTASYQNVIYFLACYPDIQEKVFEEINRVIPEGQPLEYEHLAELKYTEQVINESLRMYPLLAYLFRWTKETKTYNGITIPAGTMVQISSAHIMMDSENWPDPEKFDPDRFSPENRATRDPLAFLGFGSGPRVCLGKRLSMVMIKVVTIYLLRRVNFMLSDRSIPKKGGAVKAKSFPIFARLPDTPMILEAGLRE